MLPLLFVSPPAPDVAGLNALISSRLAAASNLGRLSVVFESGTEKKVVFRDAGPTTVLMRFVEGDGKTVKLIETSPNRVRAIDVTANVAWEKVSEDRRTVKGDAKWRSGLDAAANSETLTIAFFPQGTHLRLPAGAKIARHQLVNGVHQYRLETPLRKIVVAYADAGFWPLVVREESADANIKYTFTHSPEPSTDTTASIDEATWSKWKAVLTSPPPKSVQ